MGKINVDYPGLLKLFPEYINPKRSESASFLIWYLENYYRLDGLEAVDSVCDKRGDKGVDGLFVNDNDKTITVYQSRINQSSDTTIGDASLRAFAGTLSQFNDADSIQNQLAYFERVARLRAVVPGDGFQKWVRMPNAELDDKTPLNLLAGGEGQVIADLVDDMLTGAPA